MTARILNGGEVRLLVQETSLGDFFFTCAEKNGEKICQIDANIDKLETYKSVKMRSVRLALSLQKKGLSPNDTVLICSRNTLDNIIPLLSTLFLASKTVHLDPTFSVRTAKYLMSLVTPKIIFVDKAAINLIMDSLKDTTLTPEIIALGNSDQFETYSSLLVPHSEENDFRPVEVDVNATALMFFSSGTTGLPKTICHSHKSFLQILNIRQKTLVYENIILHFSTFYWISAMTILCVTFLNGGTRVFAHDVDGETMFKMIEKYQLSCIFLAPIYTYKLTSVKNPEMYETSSLRSILIAGTPISPEQYKRLYGLFENAEIIFGYAITEVGAICSFDPETDKLLIKNKSASCGKVLPGTFVKIVNPDTEELLGPNKTGEIRAKSKSMMQGYYNLTCSESFDSEGFFKTGDLGYFDDDECFYVVGRLKEMFKYLSWHIVPSSIEAVLLEHPDVAEAVVFGVPRAEEGEVPAACVVLNANVSANKEDIEKFVAERVADREKLRGGVYIVDNLPKTPTGKIIRDDVRTNMLKSM